ncbi:unnamed protein product [Lactuca saligna]|uniref:TIR domain-containing protein n=1 Tax=Lactuca saligna TaxID=75948 RepID=A0AA36E0R4_LACSI|nr:unnamed protein product [Lactuca saligna]
MVTEEGSSSSLPIVGHKYDVFIETGEDLKPELESAIKASRVFLIVLSKNYAGSKWCLEELVLILEQRRTLNHIVIPIFYDVAPTAVRKQLGSFGDAIAKHKQAMEAETDADKRSQWAHRVDRWTKALGEVGNLFGMSGDAGQEAELIQIIVEYLKRRLCISSWSPLPLEIQQPNHSEIPLQAINNCTQNFNKRNFIGKGGYGNVYKGNLTWGAHVNKLVAVKRLDVTGFQGSKEFHTELTMLSQHHHKNIVTLIGFCDANKEMILVYEYASHGSLDRHLLNPYARLTWLQLLKICVDIASALDYLHNHVADKHRIIHRDIKSANILLDENWNAKLADFGLAKIGLANQQNTFVITNLAGTHGYCDPQYRRTGFLTTKSDVYSFGVVLFEVLCGRLACDVNYNDQHRFLCFFAPTCYKNGELDKIIDPRIKEDIKPSALVKFSAIAYRCLLETREDRPTIAEVAFQLKETMKNQLEDGFL